MESEALKEMVRAELSRQDFHTRLENVVREMKSLRTEDASEDDFSEPVKDGIDEKKALRLIKSKGLLDDIVEGIKMQDINAAGGDGITKEGRRAAAAPLADPGEGCFLHLQLVRGRAFIEHLMDEGGAQLQVSLAFRTQRLRGQWTPCSAEPRFDESFLIRLSEEDFHAVSLNTLLATRDPVHLVLVKRDPSTGETVLVASHFLEWRIVLCSEAGRAALNVELHGVGTEAKMTVGLLELRAELLPRPHQPLTEAIVSSQISLERGRLAERERIFLVYAKQWWREYLQVRENHANRLVKIFAQDENAVSRFVCCHVRPLRAPRLIESPRRAARFVSCLALERSRSLGAGPNEQWSSLHALLASNRGDVEDHAVLLCSLLLGFGLDAYVAIGTKVRPSGGTSPHAWVITLGCSDKDSHAEAIFWEPLTGARFSHQPLPEETGGLSHGAAHGYASLGCVFNHRQFLANSHPTDRLAPCRFALRDEARWKAMSEDAIAAVTEQALSPCLPALAPSPFDPVALSDDLESQLRASVADMRRERGLTCAWDDQLSFLLSQALCAYESERATGVASGNEEFQAAIRRHVPDGHTFKGYPLQVLHANANRALRSALKSPVAQQIVGCRGDFVRLAVRARVYSMAESVCATWVMLACTYKSTL